MSWENRVVWSEGMFLRPQHFQQHDRFIEKLIRERVAGITAHSWGVIELELNRELMDTGQFAVRTARGMFADGTPFSIPEDAEHPEPRLIGEGVRDAIVYLAIPDRQPGSIEAAPPEDQETPARYSSQEFEARDTVAGDQSSGMLSIGKMRVRYLLQSDERAGYMCLGVARIIEVRPDNRIVLDDQYIPPTLACRVSNQLNGFINELMGLFNQRGNAIAGRAAEGSGRGVGEIADFLMLLMINRWQPLVAHLSHEEEVHPERLYSVCLQIAGEIATFTKAGKRPAEFPPYRHDDLKETFRPLMADIRSSFGTVLEQPAIEIPISNRGHGYHLAIINDPQLYKSSTFVLAVRAAVPTEELRRDFVQRVKIGAAEQIQKMVNSQITGIGVLPLPVAPPRIPFHAGVVYFQLDSGSPYWRILQQSSGMAFHIGRDFPNLEMQLWAIRGS